MVATRLCNITISLDQPEKPTAPGMVQECERCKERDSLENQMRGMRQEMMSPKLNSKSYGSPTRYKGKRESLPSGSAMHLEMQMSPANHQMPMTMMPFGSQNFNQTG